MPTSAAIRASSAISRSITQFARSPTKNSREWGCQCRVIGPAATPMIRSRTRVAAAAARLRMRLHLQDFEVLIGDRLDRRYVDCRLTRGVLLAEALEQPRNLLAFVEAVPGLPDELGVGAAADVDDGEAAGERLEHCVRARLVTAGCDEDVVGAKLGGHLLGRDR